MPATVYSERFAGLQGFVGTYVYTVGAGFVVVLRDVDVFSNGNTFGDFRLTGVASGTIDYWAPGPTSGSGVHQWRGRQVFHAGESFKVTTTTDPFDVAISGYVLVAP